MVDLKLPREEVRGGRRGEKRAPWKTQAPVAAMEERKLGRVAVQKGIMRGVKVKKEDEGWPESGSRVESGGSGGLLEIGHCPII